MKQFTLALLFVFISSFLTLKAQNQFSYRPGKITQYEATMKSYTEDPDAEAVVICETGDTYFIGNEQTGKFEVRMEKFIKIKILKQAGIKYGTFEIPFYTDNYIWERVEDMEAFTYNYENNQMTPTALEKKNVFTEKINDNWNKKVFTMPNLKEGSIIELKYTIISPYLFNIREWNFQKKIPVVESTFNIRVIPYYEYIYILKGSDKLDVFDQETGNEFRFGSLLYRELKYTFGKKNIPAFKDEEFIASENDYMMSLNFQLARIHYQGQHTSIMTTWPELSDNFLKNEDFGKYIKDAEKEGKKIIAQLKLEGKSENEQVKTITDYVKMEYLWNGLCRRYASKRVSDFIKEKTGNSVEINLFLLGLLKASGIGSQPVLLSTRENGAISLQHPFEKFFNYAIIRIGTGEKAYFVDATERLLVYNELPSRCTNVLGLVIAPKSEEWIDIPQNDLALTEKNFEISGNDNLSKLNTTLTFTAYAFDAYNYRKAYNGVESNLKDLLEKRSLKTQGPIQIQNELDLDKPFIFTCKTEIPLDHIDKLFIAPFLNQSVTENIFRQQSERKLPIDLIHRHAAKYRSIIHIPDGYEVESLPAPVKNNREIVVNYQATQTDSKTIEVTAEYEFRDSIYEAQKYAVLKAIYNGMVNKFNEMIVLKKIK